MPRNVGPPATSPASPICDQLGTYFPINGKEYPATQTLNVKKGDLFRIRWISLTGEDTHTMHTHGHYQKLIARDAQPVGSQDLQDTVALSPGQRVDVVVKADQQPGTWLVHCHVMDHIEGSDGMAAGLITAIVYAGAPNTLLKMGAAMMAGKPPMNTPTSVNGNCAVPTRHVAMPALMGWIAFCAISITR